jgi:hypothetical protein
MGRGFSFPLALREMREPEPERKMRAAMSPSYEERGRERKERRCSRVSSSGSEPTEYNRAADQPKESPALERWREVQDWASERSMGVRAR